MLSTRLECRAKERWEWETTKVHTLIRILLLLRIMLMGFKVYPIATSAIGAIMASVISLLDRALGETRRGT